MYEPINTTFIITLGFPRGGIEIWNRVLFLSLRVGHAHRVFWQSPKKQVYVFRRENMMRARTRGAFDWALSFPQAKACCSHEEEVPLTRNSVKAGVNLREVRGKLPEEHYVAYAIYARESRAPCYPVLSEELEGGTAVSSPVALFPPQREGGGYPA